MEEGDSVVRIELNPRKLLNSDSAQFAELAQKIRRDRRAQFLHQKRQWTKNFLNSNFTSAGRCSMSQCPVSLNVIEVTLLPIIFA